MNKLVRKTRLAVPLMVLIAGCATGVEYDAPPSAPVNVSPVEQSDMLVNTRTTFVWQASANASYYEFHIYNNANSDIEQYARRDLLASSVCQNGRCSVTLSVALPYKKDHAWRVRAGNNAGLSVWTRTRFNMVR